LFSLDDEWTDSSYPPTDQSVLLDENVPADLLQLAYQRRQYTQDLLYRWHSLSLREQQVAVMICYNYSTGEMAAQMVVSTNTIKSHVRAVLRKFDVHSRSELRLLLADFNFDNWNNLLS
jgi:DNA-binding CsgD family transcriptional regulator